VNSVVTYETAELGLLMDDDDDDDDDDNVLQGLIERDVHDYVDSSDGNSDSYRDEEIQKDGVVDNNFQNNDSDIIDDGDDDDDDGKIDESFRDKCHHHHEYEKHPSNNNNNYTTIQLQNIPLQPIATTTIQTEKFNKNYYKVHQNTSKPKIRVGFLSRFLIAHPAGILVQGLIKILFYSKNLIKSYRKGR